MGKNIIRIVSLRFKISIELTELLPGCYHFLEYFHLQVNTDRLLYIVPFEGTFCFNIFRNIIKYVLGKILRGLIYLKMKDKIC